MDTYNYMSMYTIAFLQLYEYLYTLIYILCSYNYMSMYIGYTYNYMCIYLCNFNFN